MSTLSYYCALVALVSDYLDVTSYELALVRYLLAKRKFPITIAGWEGFEHDKCRWLAPTAKCIPSWLGKGLKIMDAGWRPRKIISC